MAVIKVVVVDDEPGIRSGVTRILRDFTVTYPFMDEDFSFEIIEASTGEEGIEILERDNPEIMLLDNKLPGIQGIEVLDYIRRSGHDTMVAMITSYASIDIAVRATSDGATDFIPKPFTPQELKASVENITKQMYLRNITNKLKREGVKVRYQFLSVLSHELKAPLYAIEGYLQSMLGKESGEMVDDYVTQIERSMQRIKGMRSLIMDLLDFSKTRLEKREDKIERVDLKKIAEEAIVTVQPYAIQRDITFGLECKCESTVMADPADMEIIFNNLLSNAVKFNRDKGEVTIEIDGCSKLFTVRVSDTGIGMAEEELDEIFQEFYRIKGDETKEIKGSGLGLSIVKKVTELYGIDIKVESKPGEGSCFTLLFPREKGRELPD